MKKNKKVIFITIGVLLILIIGYIILGGIIYSLKTCGGIGGWVCPEGYLCRMNGPHYPDQSGKCFPDKFPFNLLK